MIEYNKCNICEDYNDCVIGKKVDSTTYTEVDFFEALQDPFFLPIGNYEPPEIAVNQTDFDMSTRFSEDLRRFITITVLANRQDPYKDTDNASEYAFPIYQTDMDAIRDFRGIVELNTGNLKGIDYFQKVPEIRITSDSVFRIDLRNNNALKRLMINASVCKYIYLPNVFSEVTDYENLDTYGLDITAPNLEILDMRTMFESKAGWVNIATSAPDMTKLRYLYIPQIMWNQDFTGVDMDVIQANNPDINALRLEFRAYFSNNRYLISLIDETKGGYKNLPLDWIDPDHIGEYSGGSYNITMNTISWARKDLIPKGFWIIPNKIAAIVNKEDIDA